MESIELIANMANTFSNQQTLASYLLQKVSFLNSQFECINVYAYYYYYYYYYYYHYLQSKVKYELGESLIIGAGLSKTGTTSLVKTLRDWGIRSGHWSIGHHLFRLAELEQMNSSTRHIQHLNAIMNKLESVIY